MDEKEFRIQWNLIKQPQNYEYPVADYMLVAIAHCVQKDLLIFNTRADGGFDPIFVIQASMLANRPANTCVPVLLAYNTEHYEGLVPNSKVDEAKTVELKNSVISNKYKLQKKDIPVFAKLLQSISKSSLEGKNKDLTSTEDQIPKKRIKDMNQEEKREYNRMKQMARRNSLSDERREALKEAEKQRQRERRANEKSEDLVTFRLKEAMAKARQRTSNREKNEDQFKSKRTEEKAHERLIQRKEDTTTLKVKMAEEKSRQRFQAREVDEPGFMKKRAKEKSRERSQARKENEGALKKNGKREIQSTLTRQRRR